MGSETLADDKGWVIPCDNKQMNQMIVGEWEGKKKSRESAKAS